VVRIGVVSMVKNESDIIELFLKINLRSADRIFLIDHCSQDGTLEIAKEMQKLYPQIAIFSFKEREFRQSDVVTSMVRDISSQNIVDYIALLDADEFLCGNTNVNIREIISNNIDKHESGFIPWETFCPISLDYFSSESPLFSCFKKRSKEPQQFFKVVLGNEFAKDCVVAEGNHSAFSAMFSLPRKFLDLKIQHAPVRSPEQIVRKALMGSYSLTLKYGRQRQESHWDIISQVVRANNYDVTLEQLSNIALNYAVEENGSAEVDFFSCGIGLIEDKINFKNLARPNLIRDFDLLAIDLIDSVVK